MDSSIWHPVGVGSEQQGRAFTSYASERLENAVSYTPHLFDFIIPTRAASRHGKLYMPPAYLEADAVDASKRIGQGASFLVSRQRIPRGPQMVETAPREMGKDVWVSSSVPAPPRPRVVAYKTSALQFEAGGQPIPTHRRAAESILTEFHFLTHEPLLQHPNIIDYLGLAWGTNPYNHLQKLPTLVVEYADHGTVADVQSKAILTGVQKRQIALDITSGLKALHASGLVHGDLKAENVLMFAGQQQGRRFTAKLADFGFSVAPIMESDMVYVGGTRPWQAPEAFALVAKHALRNVDVYSLGLLIWTIAIDGNNPFHLVLRDQMPITNVEQMIQEAKMSNTLLFFSQISNWFSTWCLAQTEAGDSPKVKYIILDMGWAVSQSSNDSPIRVFSKQQLQPMVQNLGRSDRADLAPKETWAAFFSLLLSHLSDFPDSIAIWGLLDHIFKHSLQADPKLRNLDTIFDLLSGNISVNASLEESTSTLEAKTMTDLSNSIKRTLSIQEPLQSASQAVDNLSDETKLSNVENASTSKDSFTAPITTVSISPEIAAATAQSFWKSRGFQNNQLSWQTMRTMPPSIQTFIIENMGDGIGPSQQFTLCACHLNGYGVPINVERACDYIRLAACSNHVLSKAYAYRIHKACGIEPPEGTPMGQWLYEAAHSGSRMALEDLRTVAPEKVPPLTNRLSVGFGGQGADWFWPENMISGSQPEWQNMEFVKAQVTQCSNPSQIVVNKRGDGILHFAASCGNHQVLHELLTRHGMDVNQRNRAGETPFLCAIRAHSGKTAAYMAQKQSPNAGIAAHNGETPMHWMVMFPDEWIEALGSDLLRLSGNINAITTERVKHSDFPSGVDIDFQLPGTPLAWAVHHNRPVLVRWLLKHGADPWLWHKNAIVNPVERAAYLHHHLCLKEIIDEVERRHINSASSASGDARYAIFYNPLVTAAIAGADRFSMILRNGTMYQEDFCATLDLLRMKAERVVFNSSVLGLAVQEAHDEVVEYICDKSWYLQDDINRPFGSIIETPVLVVVRWNRRHIFELLLQQGADPFAVSKNPYDEDVHDFTAFHIMAHEGHDKHIGLAVRLHDLGLPVEGLEPLDDCNDGTAKETPLSIAIRKQAFNLASMFQLLGADLNATSHSASLVACNYPLTILGHVIALNARVSLPRLQYILRDSAARGFGSPSFIVEPARGLSALHRAILAWCDLFEVSSGEPLDPANWDTDSSFEILHELLGAFNSPEHLDMRAPGLDGQTALHLAVEMLNVPAVQELTANGARSDIPNFSGMTALDLAVSLVSRSEAESPGDPAGSEAVPTAPPEAVRNKLLLAKQTLSILRLISNEEEESSGSI